MCPRPEVGPCDTRFRAAVEFLITYFEEVPDNIETIAENADDAGIVAAAVATINEVRCCVVLPSAQELFEQTAENLGLVGEIRTDVERPDACAAVSCG